MIGSVRRGGGLDGAQLPAYQSSNTCGTVPLRHDAKLCSLRYSEQEMSFFARIFACILSVWLAACDALPGVAPTSTQLIRTQDEGWAGYLVKVTSRVAEALEAYKGPVFPQTFRSASYNPSLALHPGDTIGVTVYETAGSNLFSGTLGMLSPQSSTIPSQIVEADGMVTVPYVGKVHVAGRTPSQAATLIQEGLSSQTVRPQVVVSLVGNTSNTMSVGGDINKAGLMPLTLRGERLLDAVAWAGGPKYPAVQVDLRLMRGQNVYSIPLQQVMANPENNILLQPNDSLTLVYNPKTFLVMGTTLKVNQYPFDVEKINLAEGIARAGGGIESTTNLAAIYLLRHEPGWFARDVLTADRQAVTKPIGQPAEAVNPESSVPILYRVDLTQADGYFMAQHVRLRDKDLVLLATAEAAQFLKMMAVVRSISGTYYDLTRSSNY